MDAQPVLISWTGELGFEIYNLDPGVYSPALWPHLLEAAIMNYGTDKYLETTPY